MANHRKYYTREGGDFPPSLGHGESYEYVYAHGLTMHKNCSNYALTNLLFSLCKYVGIINLLVICFNLHLGALSHPFDLENVTN
jgi:hypothetical protein